MRKNLKPAFNKGDFDSYQFLREIVDRYFKERGISQKANRAMIIKSVFFLLAFAASYAFLYAPVPSVWVIFPKYWLFGIMAAITSINIAHDAIHGAYSTSPIVNRLLRYVMDICGRHSRSWGAGHITKHHTFTNIAGHDADLKAENPFLRLCPQAPFYFYHRWQHFYAPLLYCVYMFNSYAMDCRNVFRTSNWALKAEFLFLNLLHWSFFIMPKFFLHITWMQAFFGYVCFGMAGGLTTALIFQLAHIVDNVSFYEPNELGKLKNTFLEHQLRTTANFAPKSKLAHFLLGGLNFQVEHHLFPHVCHIHLFNLSPIIQSAVQQLGLPYHVNETAMIALRSHFRVLRRLSLTPFNALCEVKKSDSSVGVKD
jgi:linoleoyl-CoA desaturase